MHETVIAQNLINEARKQGKVKSITVEVGEVAHVTKDELLPTLSALADFEVYATEIPAKAKCACGYEGAPKILERGHDMCLYICPKCANVPEIVEGGDIVLKTVEVQN